MLLVFSECDTNRFRYTIDFVLGKLIGCNYSVTKSESEFKTFSGSKLNYSEKKLENCFSIFPAKILFENDIKEQTISTFDFENTKAFFKVNHGDFAFDIFAATFFLISRYEEYLPFEADKHGRYRPEASLAFRNNFLKQPVVDIWAQILKSKLQFKFSELNFKSKNFSYIVTIDVDNVYAYLEKGFYRTLGAYIKSFLKFDFRAIAERTKVILGRKKDPFECYQVHEELVRKYHLKLIYFLLFGSRSKYDRNVSPIKKRYQQLVKKMTTYAEIGVHPSYVSNSNPRKIAKEIDMLSFVSSQKIRKSRQHFLRMNMPNTYEALIKCGILEDYTMGYASTAGFRAGTCTPFLFFNLNEDKVRDLQIFPFAAMDMTFAEYKKSTPFEALNEIAELICEVKKVDGNFVFVWHDRAFSDSHYLGWRKVFEETIKLTQ